MIQGPVSMMVNGQLLIIDELDPKEHKIILDVDLKMFINVADKAMGMIQLY
jgi:hypothetical protein